MIRIDALWLSAEPMDMRAGCERLLARVVQVFGEARANHGYLFANARASRVKLLVHDGFGVWCTARRLNAGGLVWPKWVDGNAGAITLTQAQFDALVAGVRSMGNEHLHAHGLLERRPGLADSKRGVAAAWSHDPGTRGRQADRVQDGHAACQAPSLRTRRGAGALTGTQARFDRPSEKSNLIRGAGKPASSHSR